MLSAAAILVAIGFTADAFIINTSWKEGSVGVRRLGKLNYMRGHCLEKRGHGKDVSVSLDSWNSLENVDQVLL